MVNIISISEINNILYDSIISNNELSNLSIKCIVKRINTYSYMNYLNCSDIDENNELTILINPKIFKHDIKINDVIIVTGNIIYKKSVCFQTLEYKLDINELSNYDKIFEKLKQEKLLDIPKKQIPNVINNIAILSSVNAAGLNDCLDIIKSVVKNIYIYPITLQGEYMETSVLNALKLCSNDIDKYNIDVILIIRGGGAKVDLEWFDNYNIAKAIKEYNYPIICGIGHEIDHTIIDVVCDKSLNTPTHVAYYIKDINDKVKNIILEINNLYEYKIETMINNIIKWMKSDNDIDKIINQLNEMYNYKIETMINNLLKMNIISEYNELKELYSDIITIIDAKSNVVIYNVTLNKIVRTKEEYMNDKKLNNKLLIKFIDGDIEV